MRIIENNLINVADYNKQLASKTIRFLRIDPEDLSLALKDILAELADFSWLNKFDKDFMKESFRVNAAKTCDALQDKFFDQDENPIISEAGEYIVSVYAKRGLVEGLNFLDIPLAELLGRKKIGNPGFDFYAEDMRSAVLACGEAKYEHSKNAYNASLEQINRFVIEKKHISDIAVLTHLASDRSLQNLVEGRLGVCAAFSATGISSKVLLSHIAKNQDFIKSLQYEFVILVAVDIYEK